MCPVRPRAWLVVAGDKLDGQTKNYHISLINGLALGKETLQKLAAFRWPVGKHNTSVASIIIHLERYGEPIEGCLFAANNSFVAESARPPL